MLVLHDSEQSRSDVFLKNLTNLFAHMRTSEQKFSANEMELLAAGLEKHLYTAEHTDGFHPLQIWNAIKNNLPPADTFVGDERILKMLPKEKMMEFLRDYPQQKIIYQLGFCENLSDIQRLLRGLSDSEKQAYVDYVPKKLFFEFCLKLAYFPNPNVRNIGIYAEWFSDPTIQEYLRLKLLDANDFLFAAALMPDADGRAKFQRFLREPLCDLLPHNAAGQSLLQVITESDFPDEEKALRIQLWQDALAQQRQHLSRKNLSIHFEKLPQQAVRTAEFDVPELDEEEIPPEVDGINHNNVIKLHRLVKWLLHQDNLSTYHEYFIRFRKNTSYHRDPAIYELVLQRLEALCINVHTLLPNGQRLEFNLEALAQLALCAEGVINALDELKDSHDIGEHIQTLIKNSAATLSRKIFVINPDMETHIPYHAASHCLGLDATPAYRTDPYDLGYTPANVKALARRVLVDGCHRDSLTQLFTPKLSSGLQVGNLLNEKNRLLLDQMKALDHIGFFDELPDLHCASSLTPMQQAENFRIKCAWLLHCLSNVSYADCKDILRRIAEDEIPADEELTINATNEGFTRLSAQVTDFVNSKYHLDRLFTAESEMTEVYERIWCILTTDDLSALSAADQRFWCQVLTSIDGVVVAKQAIELHQTESAAIKLANLLWIPEGADTNLYKEFASDISCAEWMAAYDINTFIKEDEAEHSVVLNIDFVVSDDRSPLDHCLSQLQDASALYAREFESLLFKPGAFFYCMYELNKDPHNHDLILKIQEVMNASEEYDVDVARWYTTNSKWHRYDNFMQLIYELAFSDDETVSVPAKIFIRDHLKKQKELGLWDSYMQCISMHVDYAEDADEFDELRIEFEDASRDPNILKSCFAQPRAFHALVAGFGDDRELAMIKLDEILKMHGNHEIREKFIAFLAQQHYRDPRLTAPWQDEIIALQHSVSVMGAGLWTTTAHSTSHSDPPAATLSIS